MNVATPRRIDPEGATPYFLPLYSLPYLPQGAPEVTLPMLLGVVGSPITMHDATLGLSFRTTPPQLSWLPVPVDAAPVQKTIRLANRGPAPAKVEWHLVCPPDPDRPAAAVLGVSTSGVALTLGPAPREPAPTPTAVAFSVSPATDMIPVDGERTFKVAFQQASIWARVRG